MHRIHNDTRVTRAGLPSASQGEVFLPGPTFAAPYHAAGDPTQVPFTYGRFHNPTWTRFEQALSERRWERSGLRLGYGSRERRFWNRFTTQRYRRSPLGQLLHYARHCPGLFY